jgi:hypothetical protein
VEPLLARPSTAPIENRIGPERRGRLVPIGLDRLTRRRGFTLAVQLALAKSCTLLDDEPALRLDGLLKAA